MNPFLRRLEREHIGHSGRKSEARLIRDTVGARASPASGAGNIKGDFRTDNYLFEAKSTTDTSISIKLEWLAKISFEAVSVGKAPCLVVSFVDPQGRPRPGFNTEWVMLPRTYFQELVEKCSS